MKEDGYNGHYCTEGLNFIRRCEQPTPPCQPPTVCLLCYAHKCEQHHKLHDLTVLPQPFRRQVTLLFSAGQGDNPCPRAATAAHLLSQMTGSSCAKAPGQRLASRGARPGLRQGLRLDVHLGGLQSPLRAHSRTRIQSCCC